MRILFRKTGLVLHELRSYYEGKQIDDHNDKLYEFIKLAKDHELFMICRDEKFMVIHFPDVTLITFPVRICQNRLLKLANKILEKFFLASLIVKINPHLIVSTDYNFVFFLWCLFSKCHCLPVYVNPKVLQKKSHQILLKLSFFNRNIKGFLVNCESLREKLIQLGINRQVLTKFDSVYEENHIKKYDVEEFLDSPTFKVLFVGRLKKTKGVFDTLNIAQRVISQIPNVQFIMVGGGPEKEKLENEINYLGLKDKVVLLGPRASNKIFSYMQKCDLVLIPSYYEGLGKVAIESILSCAPFVAYGVGELQHLAKKSQAGLCVTPRSQSDLADRIVELYKTPEKLLELKNNASRYRVELLSSKTTFSSVLINNMQNYFGSRPRASFLTK